ncbi:hypothetical protein R3P38DRAFT_2803704 [Favolaschia claudopus]|uniref:Uncharacterized protein n=1 Tax=Favolaschia claudopus TaxID=2862362 RepID=A0AAV9ZRZ6_9AGAR
MASREGALAIPDEYQDLEGEGQTNAAHALRHTVSALMNNVSFPLDPLYTNLASYVTLRRQHRAVEFAETVANALPVIIDFIEHGGLEVWVPAPNTTGEAIRGHIASLNIYDVDGIPSLLFQDLGQFSENAVLAHRVDNIFSKGKHTFLVNTSGSGKTRLTFEGLCQHWGFYLVGAIDLNGLDRAICRMFSARISRQQRRIFHGCVLF